MIICNNSIKGTLTTHLVENDVWGDVISKHDNMVVYGGSDILAKALVGDRDYVVNFMYLEYDNNSSPTAPTVDRSRGRAYYDTLSGTRGYCRVPLTAAPGFGVSDPEFNGNVLIVKAQTNDTYENGPGLLDGTSHIVSAALVCVPDVNDSSKDVVFSAANLLAPGGSTLVPLPKIANAQVGVTWRVKFI
jgi:hypothetical protein